MTPTEYPAECPPSDDGIHCVHWYDGEACCNCGSPEMSDAQKREQGMTNGTEARDGVGGASREAGAES